MALHLTGTVENRENGEKKVIRQQKNFRLKKLQVFVLLPNQKIITKLFRF